MLIWRKPTYITADPCAGSSKCAYIRVDQPVKTERCWISDALLIMNVGHITLSRGGQRVPLIDSTVRG